jgi:hypothetical protein
MANKKAVIVSGTEYPSIEEAAAKSGIPFEDLRDALWMGRGRVHGRRIRYVEPEAIESTARPKIDAFLLRPLVRAGRPPLARIPHGRR